MTAAALAALPTVFQLISLGVVGVQHLIAWVESIRSAAQQTGEWTKELNDAYIAALLATRQDPAWQQDPK